MWQILQNSIAPWEWRSTAETCNNGTCNIVSIYFVYAYCCTVNNLFTFISWTPLLWTRDCIHLLIGTEETDREQQENQDIVFRFPTKAKYFLISKPPRLDLGPHNRLTNGYRNLLPRRVKCPGLKSNASKQVLRWRMIGALPPLRRMSSCCGQRQIYKSWGFSVCKIFVVLLRSLCLYQILCFESYWRRFSVSSRRAAKRGAVAALQPPHPKSNF